MTERSTRRDFLTKAAGYFAVGVLAAVGGEAKVLDEREGGEGKEGREGLEFTPLRQIESPVAVLPVLKLRTNADAILNIERRRELAKNQNKSLSPLEEVLETKLSESRRFGLVNGLLWDEGENLEVGNFLSAIKPGNDWVNNGEQIYLLFGNSPSILDHRIGETFDQSQKNLYDRAVWAMNREKALGTAVIEWENDKSFSEQKLGGLVKGLAQAGVGKFIFGNEPNDPYNPQRNDLAQIYQYTTAIRDTLNKVRPEAEVSSPGLAYFGNGEYLRRMLRTFRFGGKENQLMDRNTSSVIPISGINDHYYDSVDKFLPRISLMSSILKEEGMGVLKYNLTEIGNPAPLNPQFGSIDDFEYATMYLPQILSLAVGSKRVNDIFVHSLFDGTDDRLSLAEVVDGKLIAKDSYLAYAVVAKLFARLKNVELINDEHIAGVGGARTDEIGFKVVWAKNERVTDFVVEDDEQVFDVLGQKEGVSEQGFIELGSRTKDFLAGSAKIIIRRG